MVLCSKIFPLIPHPFACKDGGVRGGVIKLKFPPLISLTLCRFIFALAKIRKGGGCRVATGGDSLLNKRFPYLCPPLDEQTTFAQSSPARMTRHTGGDNKKYLLGLRTRFGFI